MNYCETCGIATWPWTDHACPPEWETWGEGSFDSDDGPTSEDLLDMDDSKTVCAHTAEAAAEVAGELAEAEDWWDERNPYGPVTQLFWVRRRGKTGMPRRFAVTQTMEPNYTAEEKADGKD